MTEPAAASPRSIKNVKRYRWAVAGLVGVAALGSGWMLVSGPRSADPKPPALTKVEKQFTPPSPAIPTKKTVRATDPVHHPWPPKPEVAGPPAGSGTPYRAAPSTSVQAVKLTVMSEPAAPSPADLKDESLRTGDLVTAESAREILLDEKKSSSLKLAVIDKLRSQNPDEVVPVLVAFLEHPASPAAAYTKPTAIKALADLRDPRADQALQKLARSSTDERVRLTIAALQAKEKSR
jgi:hypothetical protein